jgi:aminopeptidase N
LIEAILQGEQQFEGLIIDQSKRWSLVASLNRYQYGDFQAVLSAEMARDNSDAGVKSAIYSEAIRPDADAKAKWFKVLVDNPDDLKLSTLRYIMSALFPAEQTALQAPYKERILALIPQLNKEGDLGFTRAFAGRMLPAECTAQSELELAALVEQTKAMKPMIVKAVKGTHETVERCIKVLETL